jgi:ABC-type multidrug transport system permease subunit
MKAYLAYLKSTFQLTARDRMVLFFNYVMPLLFFIGFGEGFGAKTSSGALAQVVSMVLMLGVLGSGFFGGGMRATAEREMGILRRFKVAPITPAPILVASIVTGWAFFIPTVVFFLVISKLRYGMDLPANVLGLLVLVSLGVIAFRSIGLIIAAVVNSMAESQVVIQLLYLPMLLFSGATVPLDIMPVWLQTIAGFLPATHLYLGMQGIMTRGEGLWQQRDAVAALLLTTAVGFFISMKLFRWEKEEVIKPKAKLWVLAVLAPFILIGAWQVHSKDNLRKTKIIARQMRRDQNWLIRDGRIFVGDGRVIESGGVLIRNGRIVEIFEGRSPDPKSLQAEVVEASGKTVLPGLIDSGASLFRPDAPIKAVEYALSAYLYCGVTAVHVEPDPMKQEAILKARLETGELLGAEVFTGGGGAPVLSLAAAQYASGDLSLLRGTLAEQTLKPQQLAKLLQMSAGTPRPEIFEAAKKRLLEDKDALPSTDSAIPMQAHGAALQRELELWVAAGISPKDVLIDATSKAAKRLGIGSRAGLIQPGYEATLLIVEGNPEEDILATARIRSVMFKGERVNRDSLLGGDK